jgi:pilus assembly protein CpaE
VPNDYRVMVEVRNNGVPLLQHAPRAPITQSIGSLADALCGKKEDESERDSKSRRWLNLWPSR